MVNPVSPGVYVIERDMSEYAPTVDSSVVGILGFASKGPANKATLITSPQNLINTFGLPKEDVYGQGLLGALEVLETTNQVYFVRAADTATVANASASVLFGGCPAVTVSGNNYGVTGGNLYLKVQVYDNNGTAMFTSPQTYSIPSGTIDVNGSGATQGLAISKVVGGSLDANYVGGYFDSNTALSGFVVGAFAGSGAILMVSAASSSNFTTDAAAVLRAVGPDGNASGAFVSQISAYGATYFSGAADSLIYKVQSLYPGAGYNYGLKSNGDVSGNHIAVTNLGGPRFLINVFENGTSKETFKGSLVAYNSFIEDVINTSFTDNLTSETIQAQINASGSTFTATRFNSFVDKFSVFGMQGAGASGTFRFPSSTTVSSGFLNTRFNKLVANNFYLSGGNNGVPAASTAKAAALIGDATTSGKTGMQCLDDETLNISIAMVPGITDQSVQNALITMAESTQNFIAVVAPPLAVGAPQDAINWSNGQSQTRTAAINSSYVAVPWPQVKTFSVFDAKDRWVDPSVYLVRQMCYTDNVGEVWFAPAGFTRGRLTKPSDVEVRLNQGDRDSLYSGGNILNPIVNFAQQGITIFGQRTGQRNPTALDRINVRRLMIYLRKVLLIATRQFLFEPSDSILWKQIEEVCNPLLDDIRRRRGITQFKVVCDDTTNTPARTDRNELWCKILLKPTKSAEIIIFELNLTSQSASIGS